MQKEKNEKEMNAKKLALSCAKEVIFLFSPFLFSKNNCKKRRKFYKSQKLQKEFDIRAHRLHREMVVYWRKKERELNEIRKKREKLEQELKKRQEEEREAELQKKRLEFLMT